MNLPPQPAPRPRALLASAILWVVTMLIGYYRAFEYAQTNRLSSAAGIVILLLLAGITWFLGWLYTRTLAGENWARIVLAVLGGLGVVFGLAEVANLAHFAQLGLTTASIFLLFSPGSNAWIAWRRAAAHPPAPFQIAREP